ncbi:MAG: carboxypeptidase-like regulatory domain-containing protein [Dysgonamonadaceae bacterium]|nr:carboxypeptidase-like regulatory domain-containing protein [Dysgonamonadaceae bacterium]
MAQNNGVVLDSKTNEALPGTNIYFKNQVVAITGKDGLFGINQIPKHTHNDTLYFSHIAYDSLRISFSALKAANYVVYLQEKQKLLDEVEVVGVRPELQLFLQYHELAPLPVAVYAFGALLTGNKIYVVAGDFSFEQKATEYSMAYGSIKTNGGRSWSGFSDKMQVYDIANDEWMVHPLKFGKRAYHNLHYSHDRIYVLGGKRLSRYGRTEYLEDKMEVYDIKRDTIFLDNSNPHQAMNFASCLYGDNLVVMGGSIKETLTGKKTYSDKVHLFDLQNGYWYESGLMPQAKETKGTLVNDAIYLIGGFNGAPLTSIETYNPTTGEWRKEGDLLEAVDRPAIAVNEQLIYIFEDEKIQVYDTQTRSLKLYAIDLKLFYAELFCADGKLYIVGGCRKEEYSTYPSLYLYTIDLSEFDKTVCEKRNAPHPINPHP